VAAVGNADGDALRCIDRVGYGDRPVLGRVLCSVRKQIDDNLAQNYADGKAEEIVGQALKRLAPDERNKIRILTKHSRLKLSSPKEIRLAIEDSFNRLDVKVIDYYLLQAPALEDNANKLKYFFDVVAEFVEDGRIKNIGVSNFSIELLEYAAKISKDPITVNQVSLNIFNRKPIESGLLDYCLENNIAFQAYRSLAGSLKGLGEDPAIAKIADARGLTKAQAGLSYIFKKGADITISAGSKKHWQEIFQVADNNPLTSGDIEFIEQHIPSRPHPITDFDDFIDMKLN
jgi:2,5-diketo-D-gluconate reductase B